MSETLRSSKKEYAKAYYKKNKHKWLELKWAKSNPEKNRASKLAYKRRNREKLKAYNKLWAQRNRGKTTAYARAYQLAKKQAMPKWLTTEQVEIIEAFYVNRPDGYHVDHIVPIKGKTVCGLHVPWNLQYLRAAENIAKSNKM